MATVDKMPCLQQVLRGIWTTQAASQPEPVPMQHPIMPEILRAIKALWDKEHLTEDSNASGGGGGHGAVLLWILQIQGNLHPVTR